MTIPSYKTAQMLFEELKDDKRVQALVKLLGKMQEHVIEWSIDKSPEETTYRVVFTDGKEMRGFIVPVPKEYDWQNCEWIASGTIIPAEIAKQM